VKEKQMAGATLKFCMGDANLKAEIEKKEKKWFLAPNQWCFTHTRHIID
jgi:hypothetical protein